MIEHKEDLIDFIKLLGREYNLAQWEIDELNRMVEEPDCTREKLKKQAIWYD